jgi:hypothetical protein
MSTLSTLREERPLDNQWTVVQAFDEPGAAMSEPEAKT